MLQLRPEFASLRVLGLGDSVVDRYTHRNVMYPGGNALNFAVYAKLLGADASFAGTFGTDAGGHHVRSILAKLGIPTPHCRVVEGEGGHADVIIEDGNRRFLGSNKGGVARTHPLAFDEAMLRTIAGQHFVHTSCFSYVDDRLQELSAAAPLLGYDLSNRWNEAGRLDHVAGHADVVVLSLGEAGQQHAPALSEKLTERGCRLAIMTMGSEGALMFGGDAGFVAIPSQPTNAIDTLGAGDAFATATILGLLAIGWSQGTGVSKHTLSAAGEYASRVAAAVCGVDGAFGHGRPMS